MGRIHLFEFEDQKWFPSFLRGYGTDFLQFLSNKTGMYKPIIPIIEKGLDIGSTNQIIDLCSGGGGLIWLNNELKKHIPDLQITLTDLYPNLSAIEYAAQSRQYFISERTCGCKKCSQKFKPTQNAVLVVAPF